jgi:exopolyphosphatase/guanosine-5'-triphosphate,3'-diphosphate pyrophosphatase
VTPDPGRLAVVDLGSNSVRLFLCEGLVDGAPAGERTTTVTGLRRGAAADGSIAPEALARLDACLEGYARRRDAFGAGRTVVAGTSAVRDAPDRRRIEGIVAERMGVPLLVLSGDEEAACAFAGARLGVDGDAEILVVDIGGGSTELVRGGPAGPAGTVSLQLGAVRQTERHLHTDPPTRRELDALADEAREMVAGGLGRIGGAPPVVVGVAGTITTLAAVELGRYDPEAVHRHVLSRDAVAALTDRLAALPVAERREVAGLEPDRAPVIVAGGVIARVVLEVAGAAALRVSERDILDGIALRALAPRPAGTFRDDRSLDSKG